MSNVPDNDQLTRAMVTLLEHTSHRDMNDHDTMAGTLQKLGLLRECPNCDAWLYPDDEKGQRCYSCDHIIGAPIHEEENHDDYS